MHPPRLRLAGALGRTQRGQPPAERAHHRVVGRVGLQRADRDEAAAHRVDVRHLVAEPVVLALFDPVVRAAARIEALEDRAFVLAAALDGDGQAGGRAGGHVDVEERPFREPLAQHEGSQLGREGRGRSKVQVLRLAYGQRERDGGHAEEGPLARAAHGPGIEDVLAHVRAAVDPGDHEVGTAREKLHEGQVHAVGGGAVHGVHALLDLLRPEGVLQGERLRAGADLAVGRHHVHGAERGEGGGQRLDPGGVHAVVVRDEEEGRSAQ